jgi:serine/threonine-protein kinase
MRGVGIAVFGFLAGAVLSLLIQDTEAGTRDNSKSGASKSGAWQRYANARFGTRAEVPKDWSKGPEPENGDGLAFTSTDKSASVTVFASYNSFGSIYEAFQIFRTQKGAEVTYLHQKGDLSIVSGTRGDRIFYQKSVLTCGEQIWNSIFIKYPAARKEDFAPLVTHVAASLKGGPQSIVDCRAPRED